MVEMEVREDDLGDVVDAHAERAELVLQEVLLGHRRFEDLAEGSSTPGHLRIVDVSSRGGHSRSARARRDRTLSRYAGTGIQVQHTDVDAGGHEDTLVDFRAAELEQMYLHPSARPVMAVA